VVLGAFAAHWFFVRNGNAGAFVDALVRELEGLRADSLEYWNAAPSSQNNEGRMTMLEQKIKGSIKSISSDAGHFCRKYKKGMRAEIERLMSNLSDSATGGEFESKKRKADSGRYILIVNSINEVRSCLLKTKL